MIYYVYYKSFFENKIKRQDLYLLGQQSTSDVWGYEHFYFSRNWKFVLLENFSLRQSLPSFPGKSFFHKRRQLFPHLLRFHYWRLKSILLQAAILQLHYKSIGLKRCKSAFSEIGFYCVWREFYFELFKNFRYRPSSAQINSPDADP